MKKLLSILAAAGLTATTSSAVVACSSTTASSIESETYDGNRTITIATSGNLPNYIAKNRFSLYSTEDSLDDPTDNGKDTENLGDKLIEQAIVKDKNIIVTLSETLNPNNHTYYALGIFGINYSWKTMKFDVLAASILDDVYYDANDKTISFEFDPNTKIPKNLTSEDVIFTPSREDDTVDANVVNLSINGSTITAKLSEPIATKHDDIVSISLSGITNREDIDNSFSIIGSTPTYNNIVYDGNNTITIQLEKGQTYLNPRPSDFQISMTNYYYEPSSTPIIVDSVTTTNNGNTIVLTLNREIGRLETDQQFYIINSSIDYTQLNNGNTTNGFMVPGINPTIESANYYDGDSGENPYIKLVTTAPITIEQLPKVSDITITDNDDENNEIPAIVNITYIDSNNQSDVKIELTSTLRHDDDGYTITIKNWNNGSNTFYAN